MPASNTLLTISMITKEALMVLENNLTFSANVNRDYDDKFGKEGAKIGTTLNVRKPVRYLGRTGPALSVENSVESSVPVALNTQFGVDISFSSQDLALNIDEFSDRFIKPAMATVANKIDVDGLALYKTIYNAVGTPGTPVTALKTILQAGAMLDYGAAPKDGQRALVIDPMTQVNMVDGLKGLFQSSDQIAKQYKEGNMGLAAGFKWSMDQNVPTTSVGALGGTPLVNGAGQTGASLVTNGWTAAAAQRLNAGDVFTIAGVYGVNPLSRVSTGQLQQFVVTAAVSSDASGNATIPISPAIVTSGQYQNVNAGPAAGAALTVFGTAGQATTVSLAYHKNAFTLASADLPLPGGVDMAARAASKASGMSVRMVRAYDINNDVFPCRLDVLYGWATLRPELACRVQS